jgi:hypothetical protein
MDCMILYDSEADDDNKVNIFLFGYFYLNSYMHLFQTQILIYNIVRNYKIAKRLNGYLIDIVRRFRSFKLNEIR